MSTDNQGSNSDEQFNSSDWVFADLATVISHEPQAVVSLISAACFHSIGNDFAHAVWIALPMGVRKPQVPGIPVEVFRRRKWIDAGIESHTIAGQVVKITNPARTVIDSFRCFHGSEGCLHLLRDVLIHRRCTADELYEMAETCGILSTFRAYLETMLFALEEC
jgi:hypothetical protein